MIIALAVMICDVESAAAAISITVTPVNDPPLADAQSVTLAAVNGSSRLQARRSDETTPGAITSGRP